MNQLQRRCLLFCAAMGATSLLTGLTAPKPRGALMRVDLDRVFPETFAGWRRYGAVNAFVRPTDKPVYRIYDRVLERSYVDSEGHMVMLSVAYGGTQSNGLELHRPELCYYAHGFAVRGVRPDEVRAGSRSVAVNRLMAEMPGRAEPITYWVTLAGEVMPDANAFRLRSLWYAARRTIVDGLLVRVSTIDPLAPRAYRLHDAFIGDLLRALPEGESRKFVFGHESAFRRS